MDEIARAIASQTAPTQTPKANADGDPKSPSAPNKGIDILFDLFRGQEVMS